MRIIFLGSGPFGVPTLKRLCKEHELVGVVTQPDRPAGRRRTSTPTVIAQLAADQGLEILKDEDVNRPELVQRVAAWTADVAVVIAFGQKLGSDLVAALGKLVVNLHASLLPKYRGAAPINLAVMEGETETGVSVIALAERMDAGEIYARASTPIDPRETAGELHDRLAEMGPAVIAQVIRQFAECTLTGEEQDESRVTRAPKLAKSDGTIDFRGRAEQIRCRIHGLTPWPGVSVDWHRASGGPTSKLILRRVAHEPGLSPGCPPGTVLEGLRVAVGDGAIRLLEVQVPGSRTMVMEDFVHGHPLGPGDRLVGE